ncbi:hypothetical protein AQZ59_01798 [Trueperella bernardiae]|uniref:Uncharacterized protein n=1 Tax=Trueperella bernardiae TaxID=59561 RepID=A0A0W1KH46_9ACTO|nr:hypothetical protein AQZ59_01798 [Trueperella bernardiae]
MVRPMMKIMVWEPMAKHMIRFFIKERKTR